jgi:hypothetical protein
MKLSSGLLGPVFTPNTLLLTQLKELSGRK